MTLWIDAHLSPAIAKWITENFQVGAVAVRDLGLREAKDHEIFIAARNAGATIMTKDVDFVHLLAEHGPPPSVLWLTCGNTSNAELRHVLGASLAQALRMLNSGESLVEIARTLPAQM